ncbi:MAG: DEAD/DEAH box helicase, partial [Nitratireductor sp.]
SILPFKKLGLREPITQALDDLGYETPSPIQLQAIPPILEGRDIIGLAQTGTGKTAAFSLPLLHKLAGDSRTRTKGEARVLILSPTRELASQIHKSVKQYSTNLAIRSTCVMGGVSIKPQIKMLNGGVDVLVATPGRLEDLAKQGAINYSTIEAIVLDEADQMLDIGFMPAIRRILKACKNNKQTLLFSATMPKEIKQLTTQYLKNPVEVAVAAVSKTADKIEQGVMHVNAGIKISAVIHILKAHENKRVIMFCRTKRGADKVVKRLKHEKLIAAAIHGNKSQNQRVKALEEFRTGETPILIATDIAARGIDVPGVELVINYDLPQVPEAYVHRIGRTARAGASGIAITICAPEEADMMRRIERLIKLKVPILDVPADLPMPAPLPRGIKMAGSKSGGRGGDRSGERSGAPQRSGRRPPRQKSTTAKKGKAPSILEKAMKAIDKAEKEGSFDNEGNHSDNSGAKKKGNNEQGNSRSDPKGGSRGAPKGKKRSSGGFKGGYGKNTPRKRTR